MSFTEHMREKDSLRPETNVLALGRGLKGLLVMMLLLERRTWWPDPQIFSLRKMRV
jgi:hypothetical protein